jgi:metal-dependent amidase/aminoacylase/carboxypeptidase family protein
MEAGKAFAAGFDRIIAGVSAAYGCEYETGGVRLGFPTVNHGELAKLARAAVTEYIGAGALADCEPLMGSESFSAIGRMWPSVMAHLGVRNAELGSGADLHSEFFDIDEAALRLGVAETVAFASKILRSGSAFPPRDPSGAEEAISWLCATGL